MKQEEWETAHAFSKATIQCSTSYSYCVYTACDNRFTCEYYFRAKGQHPTPPPHPPYLPHTHTHTHTHARTHTHTHKVSANICVCSVFLKLDSLHRNYSENQIYQGLDDDEAEFLENIINKETDRDVQERREIAEEMQKYKISFPSTSIPICFILDCHTTHPLSLSLSLHVPYPSLMIEHCMYFLTIMQCP